ncbi:MAG: DUF3387 domain-containing protein [Hyphomicrobium sp.]|nr:DUF3387 domain-containing protein [Hyphomicrobium sp.]
MLKLLDTHISADAVEVVTAPVNIFDSAAFDKAVAEQGTPSSKADLIASQTKRTITERMEEDPVFYTKVSKLIEDAIAEHRAKRLSDNDFLAKMQESAQMIRRPVHDGIPDEIRHDDSAIAVFNALTTGLAENQEVAGGNLQPILAATALHLVGIVRELKVVNWTENTDVQNAMRNRMDDYFFDVIGADHGIKLEPAQIDELVDSVLKLARARMGS